jgi:hypothetical protein
MKDQRFTDSVLREQWDTVTRLYTSWDATGTQTAQRAFTAAENTKADAADAAAAVAVVKTARQASIAAVAATLATLRGQAVTLSGTASATWTLAEKKALGAGLVLLIDAVTAIGKEALKDD